jgi:hypothetical protein
MSAKKTVGYKMRSQMGFEIFINRNGDITIKQQNVYDDEEKIVVLSKPEAVELNAMLGSIIEMADDVIEPFIGETKEND